MATKGSASRPSRRVLVAYGSQRGGTAEIAITIAGALREHGFAVDCVRATDGRDVASYDAIVIGGALYMARWAREARRFVARNRGALRERPVWMFSSGPLDASASEHELAMPPAVAAIAQQIGARAHRTFGGRLEPDATGIVASKLAKHHAGDWRDWNAVRAWADELATAIAAESRAVDKPRVPAPTLPGRWLLAALCGFVALTAVLNGLALALRPNGSLVGQSLSELAPTPFASFLVPGLVLAICVGVPNAVAAYRAWRDEPSATVSAFVAGSVLLIWTLAEMFLLREAHWRELGYFAIAFAILVEAFRRRARGAPAIPAPT